MSKRSEMRHTGRHTRFVVGYCHPDTVDGDFARSLATLCLYSKRVANLIAARSGPRVATARNDIVRAFLKSGEEWLFMVDADMVFGADLLDRFAEVVDKDKFPIVGGLAFIQGSEERPIRPNMMVWDKDEDGDPILYPVVGFPDNGMCKIAATGAACLAIHRSALLKMQEKYGHLVHPWFQETTNEKHEWGEDVTFCVRAGQVEIPVHVYTGIVVGHNKKHTLTLADFEPYRQPLLKAVQDAS